MLINYNYIVYTLAITFKKFLYDSKSWKQLKCLHYILDMPINNWFKLVSKQITENN